AQGKAPFGEGFRFILPAPDAACIRAMHLCGHDLSANGGPARGDAPLELFGRMLRGSRARKRRRRAGMTGKNGAIKLVAGNSNPALAQAIGKYIGTPLTKAVVRRFADMEIFVEIQENVRGADVFVIQSTSFPANDHLIELL